jgi:signal peptidase II
VKKSLLTIFIVLLLDQAFKFWVKTNMFLGQEFHVFDGWFLIHFTENNGMAFGWSFSDGEYGKLFLSIFRIVAVGAIIYYLTRLIREKAHSGLILSISLILAGALGNIIDSAFYGMLFSDSTFQVARFLPEEGGYSTFLHGKVVDMLYFPVLQGHFPDWFPVWGGEEFLFFRPVFNIADSSITVGVLLIILFQSRFFKDQEDAAEKEHEGQISASHS